MKWFAPLFLKLQLVKCVWNIRGFKWGQHTVCLVVLGRQPSYLKKQFFLLIPSNLGTFYLLVVIACSSLKTAVKSTNSTDILRIANNIRCPDPGELYIH